MRQFNLFIIKKDFYDIYINNSSVLYKTLENLFFLKRENFNYGLNLYNQICELFNTELLKEYLISKYDISPFNNKFIIEGTTIILNKTNVTILTNRNLPDILKIFNYYKREIFVCDFIFQDYFWLNSVIHNNRCCEYN